MKIQHNHPVQNPAESKRQESKEKPALPAAGPDRIEWSPRAHELAELRQAALEAPDIRQGLVDSLRQRIEAGEYAPDLRLLSRKLLEDLRDFPGA